MGFSKEAGRTEDNPELCNGRSVWEPGSLGQGPEPRLIPLRVTFRRLTLCRYLDVTTHFPLSGVLGEEREAERAWCSGSGKGKVLLDVLSRYWFQWSHSSKPCFLTLTHTCFFPGSL